jgi:hypothetical protein
VIGIPTLAWEKLDGEIGGKKTNSKIWRTKIPGGWLVRMHSTKEEVSEQSGTSWAYGGLTFLPDPDHKWDGNSLP